MRIGEGLYKGRKVSIPKGIRPAQDFVKKALFDILREIKDQTFLDLFAGSGLIGIEAISRQAKEVIFVENNPACLKKIRQNLKSLGLTGGFRIIGRDANLAIKKFFKNGERFNFIFLDPPYEKNLAKKTLKTLGMYDIVNSSGLIIIKHSKREILPQKEGSLVLFKQKRYSETFLSFYRKDVPESNLSGNL
ncbi:MAG: 16S rRNA (guanine(966)-N(2))-methyltransferase RsmD [Candidatus Omnitrophica bacterium]|nr:16S rRNA (guanine(966)-N(2))-methyltransferase RsmD [Candidatus Omnitrophota bacterium]